MTTASRESSSPLSVCLFISHFWPVTSGAENQACLQGAELARRRHRVQVLTRAVPGRPAEETWDGLEIHRALRPIKLGPAFGASFVMQAARWLIRRGGSFQLVHAHQGLWEAVATGLARRRLGRPTLVQPAAGGWDGEIQVLARTHGRRLLRRLILRNDHFAAISKEIAEELLALGVPPERITLLASGVDAMRFAPGPSPLEDRLPARPRVLFVGRLHPQKNLGVLLQAWWKLLKQGSGVRGQGSAENVEGGGRRAEGQSIALRAPLPSPRPLTPSLILVGDGPERETLQTLSRHLGIADSVQFVGAVDNVLDYLRAADVFVLPSRAEGSPNALLEAMATGLACIVSNIGGNVDLIEDGVSGLVVRPDDVAGWARAIGHLLTEPARAAWLGQAARRWVEVERSLPVVVDRYEALYYELVCRHRRPGGS